MDAIVEDFDRVTPDTPRVAGFHTELRPPTVSFIITNFNYRRYIKAAIDSVANQTYESFECIIVDDCSTDGSADFAADYLQKLDDPRFRLIRLGANLGQMGAMKAGLENLSGTFVTFLDADDILLPSYARKHVEAHLNAAYSCGVTACDTYQIDQDGSILEATFHMLAKYRTPDARASSKPISANFIPSVSSKCISFDDAKPNELFYLERHLGGWLTSACSSLMFRRDLLNLITPRDTNAFRICGDYYFSVLAHLISGTIVIPESLACWRLHRQNNFSNKANIGGKHAPGSFHDNGRLDGEIAKFVMMNFETLSAVIGAKTCRDIVCKFIPQSKLYRASRKAKAFRNFMGKGSVMRFWWRYGFYYRYFKKR